jgi:hypothetical protein
MNLITKKKNRNTRKNKRINQKGGEWGTFFFGSIFGAAIFKWLNADVREGQIGGKKCSKTKRNYRKTRKNNI